MSSVDTLRRFAKLFADIRVFYALWGLFFSIFAHELFHVLMHLGDIQSVHLFPDWNTVVEIDVDSISGAALAREEFVAYAITVGILLITAIDIVRFHDERSDKAIHETTLHRTPLFAGFDDVVIAKVLGIRHDI